METTDEEDERYVMASFAFDVGKVMGALSGGIVVKKLKAAGCPQHKIDWATDVLTEIVKTFYRR